MFWVFRLIYGTCIVFLIEKCVDMVTGNDNTTEEEYINLLNGNMEGKCGKNKETTTFCKDTGRCWLHQSSWLPPRACDNA